MGAALPDLVNTGANIVGSVVKWFDEKERRHQEWLKERPDMVDLSTGGVKLSLEPNKGYLEPSGGFQPAGYDIRMEDLDPPKKGKNDGGAAFTYASGIGPLLMNGCYGKGYLRGDPCYNVKSKTTKCLDMIESAAYVGVGFDGIGDYNYSNRRKSIVQRMCANKGSYQGEQVPDTMNVF